MSEKMRMNHNTKEHHDNDQDNTMSQEMDSESIVKVGNPLNV